MGNEDLLVAGNGFVSLWSDALDTARWTFYPKAFQITVGRYSIGFAIFLLMSPR